MHKPIEFFSFEEASATFTYCAESGEIRARDGRRVDGPAADGYRSVRHAGRLVKAHRLAWLLATGHWPQHEIDHINGVRNDNRLANLRDVTRQMNAMNQKRHRGIPHDKSRPIGDTRIAEMVTKARNAVTKARNAVTQKGDILARARPPYGGMSPCHPVTQPVVTVTGVGDSDTRPEGRRHHHQAAQKQNPGTNTWMHLAAMNLLADHAAGIEVAPAKLTIARRLLGIAEVSA